MLAPQVDEGLELDGTVRYVSQTKTLGHKTQMDLGLHGCEELSSAAPGTHGEGKVRKLMPVTFRILGVLQFAMLVITFRNMVKRG